MKFSEKTTSDPLLFPCEFSTNEGVEVEQNFHNLHPIVTQSQMELDFQNAEQNQLILQHQDHEGRTSSRSSARPSPLERETSVPGFFFPGWKILVPTGIVSGSSSASTSSTKLQTQSWISKISNRKFHPPGKESRTIKRFFNIQWLSLPTRHRHEEKKKRTLPHNNRK